MQKGFTLIEVMVVVVILGVLASIIVPNVINRAEDAKIVKAKQDILALENALEMYKLDNGFYPSTDQGLSALVQKPDSEPNPANWRSGGYLKQLRNDPWGNAYQYLNPGNHKEIDIFSNGKPGKTNENLVIGNWETDEKH
jgi:general secretion pathway protein G